MSKHFVNWFEIPVTDLDRAKKFYGTLLGVEMTDMPMPEAEMSMFPMVEGAEGATGTLIKTEGYAPSTTGVRLYFSVDSIEDHLSKVDELGGKVILGKTSIGEHGFFAIFEDTEGNHHSFHSMS